MQRNKKILVTGATGFIGFELSKQLTGKNMKPSLLVRRPLRASLLQSLNPCCIIQGDLASPESLIRACKGINTIVHLGARAVFEEYDLVKHTIVDGSINLMNAAIDAKVKHFIYASSLLVYDSQENPIDQKTPLNPRCGYGVAKVEAEHTLTKMAKASGMKLGIIRFPHVYGARDLMFEQVRKGIVYYPGNGQNVFAHLHVHDAANLLIAAVNQEWVGISPVADELNVSWNEYFGEIKKYYPRIRTYSIPEWLAWLFTWAIYPIRRAKGVPSVYTPGSVISWNLNLPVKNGLLWNELHLRPKYPSISDGIPAVLDDCIPFQWVHPINDCLG